ncbi:MAG: universal stress protein [Pelatocladus maniniholoensis HA4357-MV3]|jgi:two-component system sensor histidine kinase KdpD|uniref:Universal stress protein n=1 Tax=Pelatocladus maniniholoensis HA4357-MV3 TaxID=1117104 RepID=A0A9E3LUF7_9NOST|nr:universal stress protein [Pelatocladus maniniholoensis HA4357-MV3]BAZ69246.1 osmosensitive K+ channel histidine kinase sensor subunit [Fischerella sp. NIES-4106]
MYPARRGKHKIFIGMAPGVGKTYRMLEEGHALKEEGIDVVVGLLETHERKETAQMAEGLEILPRKQIPRGNLMLTEMDTDAILVRSPQLVLIDELAHTNVPGSPHEKRYQDVEIVLQNGIDVYSTMNIQHLESLNDLVARITGVVVRERVPDKVLDDANEVVVIDVTPETLQERLLEGKIYASQKIQQALDNFFQRRNLVALRELALREIADNVEEEAREMSAGLTSGVNPQGQFCNIRERVLVCISTYPNSLQLLRRGARIANYMNAPLFALFVADSDRFLTKEESLHIDICEKLCKEFEGNFIRVPSNDIAEAIAQVAEKYHITQIVIGASQRSRWQILLKGSLAHKLLRSLKNTDLHIIAIDKKNTVPEKLL